MNLCNLCDFCVKACISQTTQSLLCFSGYLNNLLLYLALLFPSQVFDISSQIYLEYKQDNFFTNQLECNYCLSPSIFLILLLIISLK